MSRNKIALLLLLCLCICAPAFAESASLISPDKIVQEAEVHETHTVETGLYEKTGSSGGVEFYPYTYQLRFDINGAKFVEYKVKRNDVVKKGDVLAVFSLNSDEVTLTSKKLSLENTLEDLEEQTLSRQEAIDDMMKSFATVTDPYDRQILALRVERAEIALDQYTYQQQLKIADLQEEIAELEEDITNTTLVAPADGVVTEVLYKRAGDRVSSSEVLMTLYRTDGMLIEVDNSNGYFRYGMEVSVDVGRPKERQTLTGRVVGTDEALPASRKDKTAYIALDPFEGEPDFIQISVYGTTYFLDNVVIIPRGTATFSEGKYYVNKLVDGQVQKRYINFGMQNTSHIWVIQGLEPGELIIDD